MVLRHLSFHLALALIVGVTAKAAAQPANPQVYKEEFDRAARDAEVVARVRVLATACMDRTGEAGNDEVLTLQVALQVQDSVKGPLKKNQIVVIAHKVAPPAGPGPRSYGYMAAVRKCPFTPGVKGDIALNWDNDNRAYVLVAGWVAEPNGAAIPREVGKAYAAGDKEAK